MIFSANFLRYIYRIDIFWTMYCIDIFQKIYRDTFSTYRPHLSIFRYIDISRTIYIYRLYIDIYLGHSIYIHENRYISSTLDIYLWKSIYIDCELTIFATKIIGALIVICEKFEQIFGKVRGACSEIVRAKEGWDEFISGVGVVNRAHTYKRGKLSCKASRNAYTRRAAGNPGSFRRLSFSLPARALSPKVYTLWPSLSAPINHGPPNEQSESAESGHKGYLSRG